MIKKLKYFHGTGVRSGDEMPDTVETAVSVGASHITAAIDSSFESERIAELAGVHGYQAAGDPVEVDVLAVATESGVINVTVYNRGIALLLSDDEKMRRLHRFFGTITRELAR